MSFGVSGYWVTWPRIENGVTYHLYIRSCPEGSQFVEIPERQPVDLLPQLLEQLKSTVLPKPVPVFELLDPEFGWAYVQTPLDFRAGGDSWRTVSVTASIGPVWATVTAVPTTLTFDPGDPRRRADVVCSGGGPTASYVAEAPGACSYTYVNASSTSPVDGYHFQTSLSIDVVDLVDVVDGRRRRARSVLDIVVGAAGGGGGEGPGRVHGASSRTGRLLMARTLTSPAERNGTVGARDERQLDAPTPSSVVSLSAPKQRRPSWVMVGVVVVGVRRRVGGVGVHDIVGHADTVLVAGRDIAPGEVIAATDLRVVEMGAPVGCGRSSRRSSS